MEQPLVIIADPNNDRAEATGNALNGGFEVVRIRNAREALAAIRARRPAAVVVDFPFPLDGGCLAWSLHGDPATADIPVVAFSGWDFPRTRRKAREYGCRVFVPHADGTDGVARAVRELLEREPVPEPAPEPESAV